MTSQSVLQSIKYSRGALQVLDQLKVPHELIYRDILSVDDGIDSIKTMQVRGAPLIAMVGCLSVAVELTGSVGQGLKDNGELMKYLKDKIESLIEARPTAVNMRKEGHKLVELAEGWSHNTATEELKVKIINYIEELLIIDVKDNTSIGLFGAEAILKKGKLESGKAVVITHCNTGSLATAGYGTALGVIRALHEQGKLEHVYFTETRPYNQGARLTAFELLHDKIPSTLICDSAASYLMKSKLVSAIVVGADRVTRNGDTANKVGTYQLAVSAKAHDVPFFIAAPFSSIDGTIETGDDIVIEQRSPEEVTTVRGIRVAPEGVQVWNPAFDVTPAALIEGIVTERGVYKPNDLVNHLCAGMQL